MVIIVWHSTMPVHITVPRNEFGRCLCLSFDKYSARGREKRDKESTQRKTETETQRRENFERDKEKDSTVIR